MALLELGHLSAFGARICTGKRMRLCLGRREPPLPPRVLPSTALSPGVLSSTTQALLSPATVAHALPSAESLRAMRPRDLPMVSPGKVFVTVVEVQDFIVSKRGQRPPMWATTGLLERPQLRHSLCTSRG